MTALVTTAVAVMSSAAQTPVGEGHAPLPWHLASVRMHITSAGDLNSLSCVLNLLDDVPLDHRLFISPMGGYSQTRPFYLGQQTRLTRGFAVKPAGQFSDHLPEGLVFSRWGDMDPASVRASVGGWHLLSDHEDTHASVKVTWPWRKGRYTYRLSRQETVKSADGVYTWVAAFVTDHRSDETIYIGSLRFPGSHVELNPQFVWFVEVYRNLLRPPPKTVPQLRLIVSDWRLNEQPLALARVTCTYPEGVPQVAEVKLARRFVTDGDCAMDQGVPLGDDAYGLVIRPRSINRRPGQVTLWPELKP